MTPRHSITIIIVNYNGGEHLARCLRSLAPALDGPDTVDWQAIVVDNASQDGSEREALTHGPRVRLVRSEKNVGFASAVNHAAAATPDDLLLLLNPDAELAAGVVSSLIDELERFPECAIIGPGILNEDGSLQGSARGDPTVLTGLFGRAGRLTRMFPDSTLARRNVLAPELPPGETSREVDWVSGACMLIRRAAFDRCGGFDADYFLYWEDADLCRRLRALGCTIRYAPGLRVRHTIGQSSRTARPLAIRAFHASAFRYYRKHMARGPFDTGLARAILAARREWLLWRASSA
jgi:N-acetylglucosaminyl-diphospho-decaprenol L-rhamnosyltransferase